MIAFFQLATGCQIRDETIEYIVANNAKAIVKGVKTAFSREMDCLGVYKSHTQGVADHFGNITLDITYIEQHGDEETATWQLRPVTLFT